MCDRSSFRTVYLVSSGICLLGNLIYLLADVQFSNSLSVLAVSRFIVGFGAGNRSVCRANVATMSTTSQRLRYLTVLATVVFLGYALTPGLGSLVANVDVVLCGMHFNKFTSPGMILIMFNVLTIIGMLTAYEPSIGIQDGPHESPNAIVTKDALSNVTSIPERIVNIGVVVFIFLNFAARGILSVFETVNIPLFFQTTDSDPNSVSIVVEASKFQFYVGLVGLVPYFSIECFRQSMTDVNWVHVGFTFLLSGNVLLAILPASLTFGRLACAEVLVWSIGCPTTTAVVVVAFSKLLGSRPQGTLMDLLGSAGSIGRIILPLMAKYSTHPLLGDEPRVVYGTNTSKQNDDVSRVPQWYANMAMINFVEFAAEASRGVVLATLFLYSKSLGGGVSYMGVLTSLFSVGRLLSSMLFGCMCDHYSFRSVYLLSSAICLVGNVLYLTAEGFGTGNLMVLSASRFLVGFGAGNRSVCRADVANLTTTNQRLPYMTLLSAVEFLAYALTPGLGSLVAHVDVFVLGIHFSPFTAPGVILIVLNLLSIMGMLMVYDGSIKLLNGPPDASAKVQTTQNN
ncbi:hypothetical protein PsorP6_000558 [Peronosclerospora sorghi]|uniref:Uncharacterized protein n=1 Tax=Peronosclerospora sorghi TaxID=230839 RepID=A0ACC0WQI1_9STRA|nr:hypothetical protein PsorP6_000558 [Peronosclerospora sorghi]